jgi:hypothetical protein
MTAAAAGVLFSAPFLLLAACYAILPMVLSVLRLPRAGWLLSTPPKIILAPLFGFYVIVAASLLVAHR